MGMDPFFQALLCSRKPKKTSGPGMCGISSPTQTMALYVFSPASPFACPIEPVTSAPGLPPIPRACEARQRPDALYGRMWCCSTCKNRCYCVRTFSGLNGHRQLRPPSMLDKPFRCLTRSRRQQTGGMAYSMNVSLP